MRRQQLIEAAADQFRDLGYHNVGLTDIADEVGLSGPALYRHFRNKQELLLATIEYAVEDFIAAYAQPYDSLRELLETLAAAAIQGRFGGVSWRREAVHLGDEQRSGLQRRYRQAMQPLREMIAQHRPELDNDAIDLLLWACQTIFASVGQHSVKLDAAGARVRLAEAAMAVCESTTIATGPGSARLSPGARLLPASRREAAIVAAARLFAARGYQAVSIDDIGAAAGIAGPSLYHYFPSKSAILIAQLTRCLDSMMVDLWAALEMAETSEQALKMLLRSVVRTSLQHGVVLAALLNDIVYVPADERLALRRIQQEYAAEWVALLTGHRPELSTGEAQLLVEATHTMIGLLCSRPRFRRRPAFPDELIGLGGSVLGLR